MFNELNANVRTIKDGIDTKALPYAKLRDFIGKEVLVDGFFFTNGKFGEQVAVVGNGYVINMPSRAVEQFKAIRNDKEMLNAVLTGHLKLTGISTKATKLGVAVIYTLTDC